MESDFNIPRREAPSTYTLQKMNQLHHEIVRRIVLGQKDHMIAEALGVTTETVRYTKNSPVVQQKLDIMMGARDASSIQVAKQIQALAPLALHDLAQMMEDETVSHTNRRIIAQDILDRAGHGAIEKKEVKHSLTADDIQDIKDRARKSGAVISEPIEDAEIIDDNENDKEKS